MFSKLRSLKIDKKLYYILALAGFLILVRISQVDFLGDNAHYTIRSLGYLDTMFSDKQTTPLNWFDNFPWWANLSFHDHPFLLFFIQHIFLSVHESIFFAKLPYVLFSLGTLIVVYQWAKESYGEEVALWASLLLSVNSLFLYTARTGYMEAGVIFFIALTLYFFLRFIKDEKYWLHFGIFFGLCFLVKYSTFFLIPSLFVYILIKHRGVLKRKKTYYALLTTFIVSLPILIYNLMMYKATGHFDFQFSRLFHTDSPWAASDVGTLANPLGILFTLGKSVLFPYLVLSVVGLVYALFKKKMVLVGISFVFLTMMFIMTGANYNHLDIYNLFLALPLAYLIVSFKNWKKVKFSKIIVWFFVVYLGVGAFNSHILIIPFMQNSEGWLISAAQSKNLGIYQLDQYIEKLIKENNIISVRDGYVEMKSKKSSLVKKYGTKPEALQRPARQYKNMIIYDDNLNWFVELWPFKRRRFYHNLPILSTEELIRFAEEISIEKTYFIKATEDAFLEGGSGYTEFPIEFEKSLIEKGIEPVDYIYRTDGKEVFKVYIFDSK